MHAYYKDFEQYKRHNSIVYVDGEPVDAVEPPQLLKVKSKSKAKTAQKQKEDVFKLGNLTDFEKVKV